MPANSRWDLIRRLRVNFALYNDLAVLRYDGVSLGEWFPKFRRKLNAFILKNQAFLQLKIFSVLLALS